MPKFHLNKLVRNGIVKDQQAIGQTPTHKKLSRKDHHKALIEKVIEETRELGKSVSANMAKELADVQQALDDLAALNGIDKTEIARIQKEKAKKMGTFSEGLYISTLEMREDDPWVKYYRREPDRFPEE